MGQRTLGGQVPRTAPTEPLPRRPPRTRFYATVGCLSVITGLLLGVGGFFGVRALQDVEGPIAQGEGTTTPGEPPQSFDEVPVGPDQAVPFGGAFPVRSTLFDGEAEVTSLVVDWDATAEIHEANSFNEVPAEGSKYILLTTEAVYHGADTFPAAGASWTSATYVEEDGTEHPRVWLVTPGYEEVNQQGEITEGGIFLSEFAMEVPVGVEGGGHFVLVGSGQDIEEGVWVQAS